MRYLNTSALGTPQEEEELLEFLAKEVSDVALPPKSRRVLAGLLPHSKNSNNMEPIPQGKNESPFDKYPKDSSKIFSLNHRVFDNDLEEAFRRLSILAAKLVISQFLYVLMTKKMAKFGAYIIEKNKRNEKMVAAIDSEVSKVYMQHPEYKPCSLESFTRTSYWKRMTAKYRDKNAKEIAKLFGWKSLNVAIRSAIRSIWKSPFSRLLVPPVKIVLAYMGFKFYTGTICNLALSFDDGKNTVGVGLDFKPSGFRITSLVLFTWTKDRRLVQTFLEPPPYNTYRITKKDAKEIMNDVVNDDIDTIKDKLKVYGKGD